MSALKKYFNGFAGINNYTMYDGAGWIDKRLPPGYTNQTALLSLKNTLWIVSTLQYFFWSPNLIWCLSALFVFVFFPYDIDAFKDGYPLQALLFRFGLNYCYCFAYYAYWYVTLYWFDWSERKYSKLKPNASNLAHDLWFWSLGVMQFTAWECLFMRLWAVGLLPFQSNPEAFGPLYGDFSNEAVWQFGKNAMWIFLVPIWRDLHFYMAHRFLHIRCMYKYVHSLHHRNHDPEPFSGMCMVRRNAIGISFR